MTDMVISIIRTVVPTLVGALVALLATWGINLDPETSVALHGALTGVFTAAYYALARFLETKYGEKFGWLLGYAKTPKY